MRAADSLSLRLQKQGEGIVHQLALLQRDAAEQRNGGNDLQLQLVPRNGIDIFFREQICEIFPDKSTPSMSKNASLLTVPSPVKFRAAVPHSGPLIKEAGCNACTPRSRIR